MVLIKVVFFQNSLPGNDDVESKFQTDTSKESPSEDELRPKSIHLGNTDVGTFIMHPC